jgi:S1-C subfamily serine protease
MLKSLTAAVVIVGVGVGGFLIGNGVAKTRVTSASPRFSRNGFFPGNSGNFPGFNGFPSITLPTPPNPAANRIAAGVDPGLVDINTGLSYQQASAAGTGMILTKNGLVLTNNHVIAGATSISVRDVATNKVYEAKVLGYDSTNDVALLKLKHASNLTTVKLGNSHNVSVSEKVIGIGNAGGVGGTPSIAPGAVIGVNKSVTATDQESPKGAEHLTGMIESNAAIEPGDSGGPLVNSKGRVIGMDTAGSFSFGNVNFTSGNSSGVQAYSIPINTAIAIAKSIEHGHGSSTIHVGSTAFMGVEVTAATTPAPTNSAPVPTTSSGVPIVHVISGEPAANAGLIAGDVITALNGVNVSSPSSLAAVLQTLHAGQKVQVRYFSPSGQELALTLQLASGPPQ